MTFTGNSLETDSFLRDHEIAIPGTNMDGYFLDLSKRIEKIRTGDTPNGMLQELKSRGLWRAVFAEFIATMVFLFIATMAAVPLLPVDGIEASIVKNALASGLMIAICIQMFGHVSGAFMNPAVTISFAVGRTISPLRAFLYVLAQCIGGSLGVLILKGVTPDALHGNLGVNMVSPRISAAQGFGCEVVFTFILVISVYGCIDSNRPFFGSEAVGIGFTIAGVNLAGIPFTGASMNPARSFSAALISNSFENHWVCYEFNILLIISSYRFAVCKVTGYADITIQAYLQVYWAGPILGGSMGALAYTLVFDPYKNVMSFSDAAKKLMSDNDAVKISRDYFETKFQINDNMKNEMDFKPTNGVNHNTDISTLDISKL